jgi:transcriptional regulator with XRE-family HTH domain
MTIGDRLLKLRRERNLSQEDLANELDVSRQTISKWETNQSTPDFDKIVPLCNFFGITTDELLTGNKDIVEAKADNVKSKFARNIAIAVMIYITSLVALIFCAALFDQSVIGVCIFFIMIAMSTGLLIYNGIYYHHESNDKPSTKRRTIQKQVTGIIDSIGLIIYLVWSFMTGAWHITWIIWIIVGVIDQIVKLLFTLKASDNEIEDIENE